MVGRKSSENVKQNSNGENSMDKEFENFCAGLDVREKEGTVPHCPDATRRFLWNGRPYTKEN